MKVAVSALAGTLLALAAHSTTAGTDRQLASAPLAEARAHFGDGSINAVTFRAADAFFPVEPVSAGPVTSTLASRPSPMPDSVVFSDGNVEFEGALSRTYTNALLVLKDGEIADERYLNGGSAADRYLSWSMAKSITSILVGIAIDQGLITDMNEPIDRYVPETRGTAYEGVTIEEMLTMRDGTSYTEQVASGLSTLDTIKTRSTYSNHTGFTDLSGLGLERTYQPGTRFNYSTLTSTLLGRLVEEASDMSLAAFTEKNLWIPAGMEAPGYWMLDGPLPHGRAVAGGGFNATLRDYGRIGQMMLDGGRANGRQIVSRDWVERSTRYEGTESVIPGAPRGYGYQWWTALGTERFEAIGIHGQFMSIDPATRTVIVKLSHWPEKGGRAYNFDTFALLDAIRASVSD